MPRTPSRWFPLAAAVFVVWSAWVSTAAAQAPDSFRDVAILDGHWQVLGVGPGHAPPPESWYRTIPPEAATVHWPGPMDIAAGTEWATSTTLVFWRPLEAPRRWQGRAVWLELPYLPGPARVHINGFPTIPDFPSGGGRLEAVLSTRLVPGGSNLLVLEIRGIDAALRLLRETPPVVRVAPSLHLATLQARAAEENATLWIDAALREWPGAGTIPQPEELRDDVYSVDFEMRHGPAEADGPRLPGATLRSHRLNPTQTSISAPVPVRDFKPWTPDDPALYTVTAVLRRNDRPIDRLRITTGFARWTVEDRRLRLDGTPVPLHIVTFNDHIVQLIEQGGWGEATEQAGTLGARSPQLRLDIADARRRAFWREVLLPLKTLGFTAVRCERTVPVSLLEAADREGMMVERAIVPKPWRSNGGPGGRMAEAHTAAELARREQHHPSLALWRIETEGDRGHLEGMARTLSLTDGLRAAFAFVPDPQRLRRLGLMRMAGEEESRAVVETGILPDSTSYQRAYEIYARFVPPGQTIPAGIGWIWTPEVSVLAPDALLLSSERLLLTRANPHSAGTGLYLPAPAWARGPLPVIRKLPPLDEILWPLRDKATSPTLTAALRHPAVLIAPDSLELHAGERQTVEVVVVLSPFGPVPESARLRLRLTPTPEREDAFPECLAEMRLDVRDYAGDARAVRVGVALEVHPDIPAGPALLEAEVELGDETVSSRPHRATVRRR